MLANTSQRLAKVRQCHPNPLDQQVVRQRELLGSIGGMGIGKVPSTTVITMHACQVAFPNRYLLRSILLYTPFISCVLSFSKSLAP